MDIVDFDRGVLVNETKKSNSKNIFHKKIYGDGLTQNNRNNWTPKERKLAKNKKKGKKPFRVIAIIFFVCAVLFSIKIFENCKIKGVCHEF